MTNIQLVYEQWKEIWEIGNPKPRMQLSLFFKLQIIPALGSVLLSGTRTGNVVAELGSFSSFGQKLNYLGMTEDVFTGLEALLTFLTFECAIFLAGTLITENSTDDSKVNWSQLFLWVSLIPVLLANIYPGLTPLFDLIDERIVTYLHTVVNSVVGVSTTLIVFVSGRVIKSSFLKARTLYEHELREWDTKRKRAWVSSNELKTYKKQPKQQTKKLVTSPILTYMQNNGQSVNLAELPQKLGVSEADIFTQVKQLEKEGNIVRRGMQLELTNNGK